MNKLYMITGIDEKYVRILAWMKKLYMFTSVDEKNIHEKIKYEYWNRWKKNMITGIDEKNIIRVLTLMKESSNC